VDVASVTDKALGPMKFLLANTRKFKAAVFGRFKTIFTSYLRFRRLSRINFTSCPMSCGKDVPTDIKEQPDFFGKTVPPKRTVELSE